jgi:hypothetical protein
MTVSGDGRTWTGTYYDAYPTCPFDAVPGVLNGTISGNNFSGNGDTSGTIDCNTATAHGTIGIPLINASFTLHTNYCSD